MCSVHPLIIDLTSFKKKGASKKLTKMAKSGVIQKKISSQNDRNSPHIEIKCIYLFKLIKDNGNHSNNGVHVIYELKLKMLGWIMWRKRAWTILIYLSNVLCCFISSSGSIKIVIIKTWTLPVIALYSQLQCQTEQLIFRTGDFIHGYIWC